MLPDFPQQKAKLDTLLSERLDLKMNEGLGYFGSSQRHTHHEGRGWHLTRADGSVDDSDYVLSDSIITVELKDVPELTIEQVLQKIDRAAEEMAAKVGKATVEKILQATEESGNVIDAQGDKLTKERLLEMISMIQFDFDEGDKPQLDMIVNPDTWDKIKDRMRAIEQDPEYQKEYQRLMARKRSEWHDRESSRKLVD
jgi:hypothetical protein